MTKSELIKIISAKYPNHSIETINKIVNNIFSDLTENLVEGANVELRRFGSFSIRKRNIKNIKNQKTIESNTEDHKVIYFRASKEFKKIINE